MQPRRGEGEAVMDAEAECRALRMINANLRTELAAVNADRARLREALRCLVEDAERVPVDSPHSCARALPDARAALASTLPHEVIEPPKPATCARCHGVCACGVRNCELVPAYHRPCPDCNGTGHAPGKETP